MISIFIKVQVISKKAMEFKQTVVSLSDDFKNQSGCLSYDVSTDLKNKNVFFLISQWKGKPEVFKHIESMPFNVLLGAIKNLYKAGKFDVNVTSSSSEIESVTEVFKVLFTTSN